MNDKLRQILTDGDFAYWDGVEVKDCPYEKDTPEYAAWVQGWESAKEASAEESNAIKDDYLYGSE